MAWGWNSTRGMGVPGLEFHCGYASGLNRGLVNTEKIMVTLNARCAFLLFVLIWSLVIFPSVWGVEYSPW